MTTFSLTPRFTRLALSHSLVPLPNHCNQLRANVFLFSNSSYASLSKYVTISYQSSPSDCVVDHVFCLCLLLLSGAAVPIENLRRFWQIRRRTVWALQPICDAHMPKCGERQRANNAKQPTNKLKSMRREEREREKKICLVWRFARSNKNERSNNGIFSETNTIIYINKVSTLDAYIRQLPSTTS